MNATRQYREAGTRQKTAFEAASFNFKTTRLVSAIEEHDPAGTHGHHGLESPRLEHNFTDELGLLRSSRRRRVSSTASTSLWRGRRSSWMRRRNHGLASPARANPQGIACTDLRRIGAARWEVVQEVLRGRTAIRARQQQAPGHRIARGTQRASAIKRAVTG